ncbi:hypothetical protein F8388_021473, partial [Cannabis sativa]
MPFTKVLVLLLLGTTAPLLRYEPATSSTLPKEKSLLLGEKTMTATSAPQRIPSSAAFLNRPERRLEKTMTATSDPQRTLSSAAFLKRPERRLEKFWFLQWMPYLKMKKNKIKAKSTQ